MTSGKSPNLRQTTLCSNAKGSICLDSGGDEGVGDPEQPIKEVPAIESQIHRYSTRHKAQSRAYQTPLKRNRAKQGGNNKRATKKIKEEPNKDEDELEIGQNVGEGKVKTSGEDAGEGDKGTVEGSEQNTSITDGETAVDGSHQSSSHHCDPVLGNHSESTEVVTVTDEVVATDSDTVQHKETKPVIDTIEERGDHSQDKEGLTVTERTNQLTGGETAQGRDAAAGSPSTPQIELPSDKNGGDTLPHCLGEEDENSCNHVATSIANSDHCVPTGMDEISADADSDSKGVSLDSTAPCVQSSSSTTTRTASTVESATDANPPTTVKASIESGNVATVPDGANITLTMSESGVKSTTTTESIVDDPSTTTTSVVASIVECVFNRAVGGGEGPDLKQEELHPATTHSGNQLGEKETTDQQSTPVVNESEPVKLIPVTGPPAPPKPPVK